MDAIFDLVISSCLALLSRKVLMDFNLVWSSCFSAILSIFFALSDFKVDFNLMYTSKGEYYVIFEVALSKLEFLPVP